MYMYSNMYIHVHITCICMYLCRWDLQRARAILEHEELLKKYNKKSGLEQMPEKKKDKMTSFLPKLEEGLSLVFLNLLV